jgi:predicted outer membrane protein
LANQAGIGQGSADKAFTEAHARRMAALRAAPENDFDRVYLDHETIFSKEFVAIMKQRVVPRTRHREVKRHFEAMLPALDMHLEHIGHVGHMMGTR